MQYVERKVWKPSDVYIWRPHVLSEWVVADFRPVTFDDDMWLSDNSGMQANITGTVLGPLKKLKEFGIHPSCPMLIVEANNGNNGLKNWWE